MGMREELRDVWEAKPDMRWNVIKGLAWKEWLQHRGLIVGFFAFWLLITWVLPILFHPGFMLSFGVLYALFAAHSFGGVDAAEGSEEFSFALPPTRGQRFLVRLALGGGVLVGFLTLGLLAIGFDLPQALWSVVVNSGFTEPFPPCTPRFLYPLAFACPVAVFGFSFTFAATSHSQATVSYSWLLGALCAGAAMGAGFFAENLIWHNLNGAVSCPALLALCAGTLLLGYTAYTQKEGVSRPAPMQAASRWWIWGLVILVVVFLLLMVLWSGSARPPAPPSVEER